MRLEAIDEARDQTFRWAVLSIKKEGDAIVIVTPSHTFFIEPADEFLEAAIDLYEAPK